ncbi:hypothetical protein [Pseudomonas sp.]|uniref:hypothetical protein n=1 Tax=Pseudomonas sp. TaxID=306 RepID=UPI00258D9117|nr:hypothetical protein [Pseudomonas sp.]
MSDQKPVISIAQAIEASCAEFEKSPAFQEMLNKHISGMYDSILNDVFRWGDFKKNTEKAISAALPANIGEVADLPRYNVLLAKELATAWESEAASTRVVEHMRDMMKEILTNEQAPKFIKASDLFAAFIEEHKEKALEEGWSSPTAIFEYADYHWCDSDEYLSIGLEEEPSDSSSSFLSRRSSKNGAYQCKTYLSLHKEKTGDSRSKEDVLVDGHRVYSLHAGKLDDDTLGKKPVQFRSRFEKLIGALYYGDSLLVLDADADDIYYPSYD